MQDKAGIKTEAKIWVSIVELKEVFWMLNIVMIRDCDQLRPLQISKGAQVNKFILQFFHSLYN